MSDLRVPSDDDRGLTREELSADALAQFRAWFAEARMHGVPEPDAMTLATASADGAPSARMVLFREFEDERLLFFTNYESRKAQELLANPRAALLFYWRHPVHTSWKRQVRLEGNVRRARQETTARYFATRPFESQIGAWASPQSEVIADRCALEERVLELALDFEQQDEIAPPPHWGGYAFEPHAIEFWQGRAHRLHDRFRYTREEEGWTIVRLAP